MQLVHHPTGWGTRPRGCQTHQTGSTKQNKPWQNPEREFSRDLRVRPAVSASLALFGQGAGRSPRRRSPPGLRVGEGAFPAVLTLVPVGGWGAPCACAAPWRSWRPGQSGCPGPPVAGSGPALREGTGGCRARPCRLCLRRSARRRPAAALAWRVPAYAGRDAWTGLRGRSGRCCCLSVSCVHGKCPARLLLWHFRSRRGENREKQGELSCREARCFSAYFVYACLLKIVKPQLCLYSSEEFGLGGGGILLAMEFFHY